MTEIGFIPILQICERVALLDRIGAFVDGGDVSITDHNGDEYTGDYLLRTIAAGISCVVGARYGTGSWHASHALWQLSDDDVALLLTAYGATTFTIEQHTERLRLIIRSTAAAGGA